MPQKTISSKTKKIINAKTTKKKVTNINKNTRQKIQLSDIKNIYTTHGKDYKHGNVQPAIISNPYNKP